MKKKLSLPVCIICAVLAVSCSSTKVEKTEGAKKGNDSVKAGTVRNMGDYVPLLGKKPAVIRIDSSSGKDDFVTKPVDEDVSKAKKEWGGYKGEPAPWDEDCLVTVYDAKQNLFLDKAEALVKVRGNWTSDYAKKGLRIKFTEKQNMLGLNNGVEFKKWVLLSSYKDWSFLRDVSSLYLSKLISTGYTSDFTFADVYINDKYWGVYILAESQEVNENRIAITENEKDNDDTFAGYLLELDSHSHEDENKFNIEYGVALKDINGKQVKKFVKNYTINSDIASEKQVDFIRNYMNKLWQLCYSAVYEEQYFEFNKEKYKLVESNVADSYECVSRVIDIDSLVDTYILQEICCDPDFYMSSFYMDIDFGEQGSGKLKFEAPWDFDSALGNKNFCANSQGLYAAVNAWDVDHRTRGVGNPWFLLFANCDWFQSLVKEKWQLIHNQNVIAKITEYIDFVTENYAENFEADYEKWGNVGKNFLLGNELCLGAARCHNQKEASAYLRDWLVKRFASLDEIWLGNQD